MWTSLRWLCLSSQNVGQEQAGSAGQATASHCSLSRDLLISQVTLSWHEASCGALTFPTESDPRIPPRMEMQCGAQRGTYQKKHPLLQALLGELVKATLPDELLKGNEGPVSKTATHVCRLGHRSREPASSSLACVHMPPRACGGQKTTSGLVLSCHFVGCRSKAGRQACTASSCWAVLPAPLVSLSPAEWQPSVGVILLSKCTPTTQVLSWCPLGAQPSACPETKEPRGALSSGGTARLGHEESPQFSVGRLGRAGMRRGQSLQSLG